MPASGGWAIPAQLQLTAFAHPQLHRFFPTVTPNLFVLCSCQPCGGLLALPHGPQKPRPLHCRRLAVCRTDRWRDPRQPLAGLYRVRSVRAPHPGRSQADSQGEGLGVRPMGPIDHLPADGVSGASDLLVPSAWGRRHSDDFGLVRRFVACRTVQCGRIGGHCGAP